MTDEEFNGKAFLEWLDEQDRVYGDELRDEWPNYPTEKLVGITVSIDEDTGQTIIPKRDLRDVVVRGYPTD